MGVSDGARRASSAQHISVERRTAAAAALIAVLGACSLVAGSLVRHPIELVLSLILIVVAAWAAWTALVHRGVWRILATATAVAALIASVLVAVVQSFTLIAIAIAAGLIVISTAAARIAIGRDLAPAAPERAVLPARNGFLLMNPWSGGGKVERFDLEAEARRRGVTPIVLRDGDDLRALAEQAVADGADVLGMAGGDGSQALVADVARRHDLPFVCVPAGTRNHFALDLGLDRADVPAALDAFGNALERSVDLALIGDRVFVNNASLGVYATVVQSSGYRDAKLGTTKDLLPDLLGPDTQPFDLRFTRPDGELMRSADIVLVSNDVYRLDHLNGFGTRARLDGGQLGVVTVTVDRARDVAALLSAEAAGRVDRFRGYRQWAAREFEIDSGQPFVDVGVDGEALRLPPPLRFRTLPGALRVRTPVNAPGVTPAAVAPAGVWKSVAAVFRVLAGHPAA